MRRVVLLEADEEVLAFLSGVLERAGYSVRAARDLEGALTGARQDGVDLVIADAVLDTPPQDVVAAVRDQHPDLPIVLTSTYLEPLEERLLLALGANAVIHKPFDLESFLTLVEVLASRRVARRSRQSSVVSGQ